MARTQPQPIPFRKPVELLEVWRSTRLHEKDGQPASPRYQPVDWTPFASPWGSAGPGGLQLATGVAGAIDPQTARLLLLVSDHPSGNHQSYYPAGAEAFTGGRAVKLDVFRAELDHWRVVLIPPSYVRPRRSAFELCRLQPGETVEIRLNGKADGHHQRMYLEWAYRFRRSGPYMEASAGDGPFRVDPGEAHRIVDLRKPLW